MCPPTDNVCNSTGFSVRMESLIHQTKKFIHSLVLSALVHSLFFSPLAMTHMGSFFSKNNFLKQEQKLISQKIQYQNIGMQRIGTEATSSETDSFYILSFVGILTLY